MIGSSLGTRYLPLDGSSEPSRDRFAVRTSPPVKLADLSVPLDSRKLSGQASPPRSPPRNSQPPNIHRSTSNTPRSIGLAKQSTLVDSSTPHDTSEQPKQDRMSVPPSQASVFPTTASTVSLAEDCPRIDLIALVREKQKTKKVQRKKSPVFRLREEPRRRVDPRGLTSESPR